MSRSPQLPVLQSNSHADVESRPRDWWRSLQELADTQQFAEWSHREFPPDATETPEIDSDGSNVTRRDFLSLLGASIALATASGCRIVQPEEQIIPAVDQVNQNRSSESIYYTTAMDFAGTAVGLIVETRDGRPIKVEGNPRHPSSLGATGIFAQAATLDLYSPDRLRTPSCNGTLCTLEQLDETLAALRHRCDEDRGAGLRLVVGASTSPTIQRLLDKLQKRWPEAKWGSYEPVGCPTVSPRRVYDFSKADVILSLDADFLSGRNAPPCYVKQFADARRIVGRDLTRSTSEIPAPAPPRLISLSTTPSLTSAKADLALTVTPRKFYRLLIELSGRLNDEAASRSPSQPSLSQTEMDWLEQTVRDLTAADVHPLIVINDDAPREFVESVDHWNDRFGSGSDCVAKIPSPVVAARREDADTPRSTDWLLRVQKDMESGQANAILILGGDPVMHASETFRGALESVEFSLALSDGANATSQACQWSVPRSHFLESWGDARGHDGTASIIQPMIQPMLASRSEIELLATLIEDAPSGYGAVRKTWNAQLGSDEHAPQWERSLSQGIIDGSAFTPDAVAPKSSLHSQPTLPALDMETEDAVTEAMQLVFRPDPTIWDGRFINNGWLQELPKPLTHVVWENPVWISVADARRMGLKNGDVISIDNGRQQIELPVWRVPGHAEGCLTLFLGYGQTHVNGVGKGKGFNVQPLARDAHQPPEQPFSIATAIIRPTDRFQPVVTTQHHQLMEGRHLARSGTWEQYQSHPEQPEFAHPASPFSDASFYPKWPSEGHRWGMSIDLTTCVGCSACVIACQAENNIPVVGKEQCGRNRHMHWIRVDTYHKGAAEHPEQTLHQPVPCMHCEDAPCEVVCPVAATNHSPEGLNQMIYNRCVGTRYCSNNCPYKVRRFNFLDYSNEFIDEPSLVLLSNPEVTLRSRGVMEKCTYCVQRIEAAKRTAKLQHRDIADGDIADGDIRTACQSVCPAQAIQFGDLNDPLSKVSQARSHPLNYSLLGELNTKPRTTYLAEVNHRSP